MTLDDVSILIKKILVGILVYLVPVILIVGGLWFTNAILKDKTSATKESTIKR